MNEQFNYDEVFTEYGKAASGVDKIREKLSASLVESKSMVLLENLVRQTAPILGELTDVDAFHPY